MKAGVLAIAAAVAAGVNAVDHHAGRHAHQRFHEKRNPLLTTGYPAESTCGCTTIYSTITGEPSLIFPPAPTAATSTCPPPNAPVPMVTVFPTPGTYTVPATTITITESTTVCAATSTKVPPGTHTYGGVTTVVETATTVVCPYATATTHNGVETSTILTTTYVCPSAGTYTIAPGTTTVEKSTVIVYPTPASYAPGTYTRPETVATVTETDYVFFCPYTSPAPAPAAPTSVPAPAPKPVEKYPVAPAPKPAAPKKAPAPKPVTGGLGSSDDKWGMTYTPYDTHGYCQSKGQVYSDVASIAAKGFKILRLYSTDCSGLDFVGGAAKAAGIKMVVGVFIKKGALGQAQQQISQIVAWAQWDLVELIIVGNESVGSGACTFEELAGLLSSAKSAFQGAGYTGPVTTTETLNIWQSGGTDAFCHLVDVVGCNIHPFFNAETEAANAGVFAKSQLDIVDTLCPGKAGYNCETGWPSGGECNGVACPGTSEQATAVKAIIESIGSKSIVFSYANDDWKDPGAFNCERFWGLSQLFD